MIVTYILVLYNLTHLPLIHSAAGLFSLSLDDVGMENFKDILPFFLSAIDAVFDAIVVLLLYMKMKDDKHKVCIFIQGYIIYMS